MDYFTRNRIITGALVVLALINVITLATLWWFVGRQQNLPPSPPGLPGRQGIMGPREFIERELRLSDEQRGQFEQLRDEHRRATLQILEEIRGAKNEFFSLLKSPDAADSTVTRKARDIGRLQAELETTTFQHFRKIRAMCTPPQQRKFDTIMDQVLQMVSRPPLPDGPPQPEMIEPPTPESTPP